jgi:hypothetical protein
MDPDLFPKFAYPDPTGLGFATLDEDIAETLKLWSRVGFSYPIRPFLRMDKIRAVGIRNINVTEFHSKKLLAGDIYT